MCRPRSLPEFGVQRLSPAVRPYLLALLTTLASTGFANGQFTTVINVPPDTAPFEIGSGTQLNLGDGGQLGANFRAGENDGSSVDVEVNVAGGVVGGGFRAIGSSVNISGGSVGESLFANLDAEVAITGGSVGDRLNVNRSTLTIDAGMIGDDSLASQASTVTITGGAIGQRFKSNGMSRINVFGGTIGSSYRAEDRSIVTVTGGSVGPGFIALSGSAIDIQGGSIGLGFRANNSSVVLSGGSIGDAFDIDSDAELLISGGEFRVDGEVVEGFRRIGRRELSLSENSTFSGVLADGSTFVFSSDDGDNINGVLVLQLAILPEVGPASLIASTDPLPRSLRHGQTLRVDSGGVVGDQFVAGSGSTLIVEPGGLVGKELEVIGTEVQILGGDIGAGFETFVGSVVELAGGLVGGSFNAYDNSIVTISGGQVGGRLNLTGTSQTKISGGSVREPITVGPEAALELSGGELSGNSRILGGGEVTIRGSGFLFNGEAIPGLNQKGNSILFDQRNGVLEAKLLDGNALDVLLISGGRRPFNPELLRLTLVPEPSSGALLGLLFVIGVQYRRASGVAVS